jgi:hypothetical protein
LRRGPSDSVAAARFLDNQSWDATWQRVDDLLTWAPSTRDSRSHRGHVTTDLSAGRSAGNGKAS